MNKSIAAELFVDCEYPWKALRTLEKEIVRLGQTLSCYEYEHAGENIWIARDAKISSTAKFAGTLIIDHGAEIRHGAFLRGGVIVGKETVVGNSTELKNCVLFDQVQVPHFNYVGDSVLGWKAHLGAGAVTSNVRSDKRPIGVHAKPDIETGMLKLGAMVGDCAEIGCNSVLCPGVIVGRNCIIYPNTCVRGCIPENSIVKSNGQTVLREER